MTLSRQGVYALDKVRTLQWMLTLNDIITTDFCEFYDFKKGRD